MPQITSRFKVLVAEKELKERRRISLREISRETGVSISLVQGLANNTLREIPVEGLAKLCQYLGVKSISEVIEFDPNGMTLVAA